MKQAVYRWIMMVFCMIIIAANVSSVHGEEPTVQDFFRERGYQLGRLTPEQVMEDYLDAVNRGDGSLFLSLCVRTDSKTLETMITQQMIEVLSTDAPIPEALRQYEGKITLISIEDAAAYANPSGEDYYPNKMKEDMAKNEYDEYKDLLATILIDGREYQQVLQCIRYGDLWCMYQYYSIFSDLDDFLHYDYTDREGIANYGLKVSERQEIIDTQIRFETQDQQPETMYGIPGSLSDLIAVSSPGLTTAYVYQDGVLINADTPINGTVLEGSISTKQNTAILLSSNKSLYWINDHRVDWIEDHVQFYKLAMDGNAVVYFTEDSHILFYCRAGQEPETITESYRGGFDGVVISPDGGTVAFHGTDQYGETCLVLYRNGERIETKGVELRWINTVMAVSNGGKRAYFFGDVGSDYGLYISENGVVRKIETPQTMDYVSMKEISWTLDTSELLILNAGPSFVYDAMLARDGGPLEILPSISERLVIFNKHDAFVTSNLNRYYGIYADKDSIFNYAFGYLSADGQFTHIEDLPIGRIDENDVLTLNDGSLYVRYAPYSGWKGNADSALVYKKTPQDPAITVIEQYTSAIFGSADRQTVCVAMPNESRHYDEGDLAVVKDGTVIDTLPCIPTDVGVTLKAVYYFNDMGDLCRRGENGEQSVLFTYLAMDYMNSMPIEDFSGPLYNTNEKFF